MHLSRGTGRLQTFLPKPSLALVFHGSSRRIDEIVQAPVKITKNFQPRSGCVCVLNRDIAEFRVRVFGLDVIRGQSRSCGIEPQRGKEARPRASPRKCQLDAGRVVAASQWGAGADEAAAASSPHDYGRDLRAEQRLGCCFWGRDDGSDAQDEA